MTAGNGNETALSEELEALLNGVLQLSARIAGLGDAYVLASCSHVATFTLEHGR